MEVEHFSICVGDSCLIGDSSPLSLFYKSDDAGACFGLILKSNFGGCFFSGGESDATSLGFFLSEARLIDLIVGLKLKTNVGFSILDPCSFSSFEFPEEGLLKLKRSFLTSALHS